MRRFAILSVVVLFLLGPLAGQEEPQDFRSFYSGFRAAVAAKDKTALASMMASPFDYFQSQNVDAETVFQSLDADNGQQWDNLQQAVRGEPAVFAEGYQGRPARAVECRATATYYQCLVLFQQDDQNRWQWKAMVMLEQ